MTEFPVDLDSKAEGLGNLFIADARVLIRPARPGQYPSSVRHDSVYAYRILNLGNDMGQYDWHIISRSDPETTSRLLGQVFYAYVDACCFELWCEARVDYIVDGKTVRVERYGFEDGEYMMFFNVHCNVVEDNFMVTLMDKYMGRPVVAIRPDSSERGYEACGFIEEFLPDEIEEDFDDDPYDEECPDGCGQPTSSCVCYELASYRRHQADPETRGSWFVA